MPTTRNGAKRTSQKPDSVQTKRSKQKRPLQDITEQYFENHLAANTSRPPSPMPQSIAKPPSKQVVLRSSLPPSSPVSFSSGLRDDMSLPHYSSEGIEPPAFPGYDNEDEFEFDIPPVEPEGEAHTSFEDVGPEPTLSDPFGFFAVEKKLNVDKEDNVYRPARHHSQRQSDQPPPTPHKQRIAKRKASSSPSILRDLDRSLDIQPSSPSPAKPSRSRRIRETIEDVVDISDLSSSPPRAPVSRTRTGTRTKRTMSENSVDKPKAKKRAGKTAVGKKIAPTAKRRGKKATKKNLIIEEDVDEELLDAERQKRIEYFSKLDEYSFAKEDVYIV